MIFYFSGTGNSKHIAELLAAAERGWRQMEAQDGLLPESTEIKLQSREKEKDSAQSGMIDMAAEMKQMRRQYPIQEGERVGFVFPVYFYGVPKLVEDFIDSFTLPGLGPTNYVYTVMTCGGTTANAGHMLEKLLRRQDYNLSAQYAVRMVDNYVPMSKLAELTEQEACIQSAEEKLQKIIQDISERKLQDGNHIKGVFPGLLTAAAYPFYRFGRKTSRFVVSEKCNGCGLCERSCPYGAIITEADKPVWDKPQCILCLRCLHQCPQGAIQYGRKSEKNGRFTYWSKTGESV